MTTRQDDINITKRNYAQNTKQMSQRPGVYTYLNIATGFLLLQAIDLYTALTYELTVQHCKLTLPLVVHDVTSWYSYDGWQESPFTSQEAYPLSKHIITVMARKYFIYSWHELNAKEQFLLHILFKQISMNARP